MARLAFLCALCLLLLVELSYQTPQYENCVAHEKIYGDSCLKVTCDAHSGSQLDGCDEIRCAIGAQTGYHQGDPKKVYPDCCSYPICRA